jgi:hypothetical protein
MKTPCLSGKPCQYVEQCRSEYPQFYADLKTSPEDQEPIPCDFPAEQVYLEGCQAVTTDGLCFEAIYAKGLTIAQLTGKEPVPAEVAVV